jgi:ribonuclease P protein component
VDQRLHTYERLSDRGEYTRCYRHGERLRSRYFTVYAYHRGDGMPRLGLTAGKAVGKAVVRNRVKRRLRELFRRDKGSVPGGYDLFVRALPASASAPFPDLAAAWREALTSLAAVAANEGVDRAARPQRRARATSQ